MRRPVEKILTAKRANIKEVILCKDNKKDVDKIAEQYIKGLTITYVETIDDVIENALLDQKVKNAKKLS
jgi:ATP-dependent Lon protease